MIPTQQTARPKFKYKEVVDFVRNGIRNGKYAYGDQLPGMKDLSIQLGMNFLTVRKAMIELENEGVVDVRHGAGTFVANMPVRPKTKSIRLGIAYRTYLLQTEKYHPVVGAFLAGAHQRCNLPDFIIQPLFFDENRFVDNLGQTILSENLAGIIIPVAGTNDEDYFFLRNHNVHVVACSVPPRNDNWTITVTHDINAEIRQAIEHLRSLGHTRIAYITFLKQHDDGLSKRYFAQLAFEHRLGNPNELIIPVGSTGTVSHWEDVENFFDLTPLPTAVIVNDEYIADVLLDGCDRRGIKIPEQLSIIALQDAKPEGHRIPLTATTTLKDIEQRAFIAADLLVKRISGERIESMNVIVQSQLVVKASTSPRAQVVNITRNGK